MHYAQSMVLSRENIFSIYAVVTPVRPLLATSSFSTVPVSTLTLSSYSSAPRVRRELYSTVILKKRWPNKMLFLRRQACTSEDLDLDYISFRSLLNCRTDIHDGVWRLLPRWAGALKGRALLGQSGEGMSVSQTHWSRGDKRLRQGIKILNTL